MADEKIDLTIQGTTAIWEMSMEGDLSGTYSGTFKFRCFLTPTQRVAADRDYREMLGSNPLSVPEHESFLAYALSQLKYRVVEAPPFWSATRQSSIGSYSGDVPDENVLQAVLDAAIQAEVKYKSQLDQRKLDALERAKKAAEKILRDQKDSDEGENTSDSN